MSVLYVMEKLTSENERSTFEKMCFIINAVKEQRRKHPHRGNNPNLRTEDQLLMMLMYNREYRTFMHIAVDYGIGESQCWHIVTDIENILIGSHAFRLPGKKALTKSDVRWSVVLVDVAESPVVPIAIRMPKKTAEVLLREKEKVYP